MRLDGAPELRGVLVRKGHDDFACAVADKGCFLDAVAECVDEMLALGIELDKVLRRVGREVNDELPRKRLLLTVLVAAIFFFLSLCLLLRPSPRHLLKSV